MSENPPFDLDLVTALLAWYGRAAADLPWRRSRDPYYIWLSEIMLQQTQVTTVIPYFERFIAAFPTVQALAAAPIEDVLKLWEGLGYYRRAHHLHRAASQVVAEFGGVFPARAAQLLTLPGIGRYTANAIASIAHGEQVAVLDGNVMRVLTRIYDISDDITANSTQRHMWALADRLVQAVPAGRAGDYNQAVMELGRTICKPGVPLCAHCPVSAYCLAFQRGVQAQRPVKAPKAETPHVVMAAGVIWNADGQVLIVQRPAEGLLGGLWEFPAVECETPTPFETCLSEGLQQSLGINVRVGELLTVVRHGFTHFKLTLHAYECQYLGEASGTSLSPFYHDQRWVSPEAFEQFAFSRANHKVIEALREKPYRLL